MRRGLLALVLGASLLLPGAALAKKRPLAAGERIDLNRASVAELMRLPGIGRSRAEAILAHRQRSPFKSPGDVVQVKGIGPAWVERHRAHLTAGEAAPRPRIPPGS